MHSIVTTFREAVIKVEVANFGAAIDTLIDQDERHNAHQLTVPALIHSALWIYSSFHGQQCTQTEVTRRVQT